MKNGNVSVVRSAIGQSLRMINEKFSAVFGGKGMVSVNCQDKSYTETGRYPDSLALNYGFNGDSWSFGDGSISLNMGRKGHAVTLSQKGIALNTAEDGTAWAEKRDDSCAFNTGRHGEASAYGPCGVAVTTGEDSEASSFNGIAAAFGPRSKAQGELGSWLVLAEMVWEPDGRYHIADIKARQVDGKEILPRRNYRLMNGEFIPVD